MKEITRYDYLNKLERLKDKHFIKILTGIRRSGKSTILMQFINILKTKYKVYTANIQVYDFNDKQLLKWNWQSLIEEIFSKSSATSTNYIFLDEIQEIKCFEKSIITIFENKKYKFDIYITGSNSKMFSLELASLFTGRNFPINVYPIAFKSFQNKSNQKNSDVKKIDEYLKYGGLGIIVPNFNDKEFIKQTLKFVFEDTIKKDVLSRHRIKNEQGFYKVVDFIYEHIGKQINVKKIENFLKSAKEPSLTDKTILNYLEWLCDALILHRIKFFDAKGKVALKTKSKYYAGDLGLLSNKISYDITKLAGYRLENLVYLELRERGYEVYSFNDRNGNEIDFVAIKDNNLTYYQVTKLLDDANYERESRVLLNLRDGFTKVILCVNDESSIKNDGINIVNIAEWLLLDK